MASFPPSPVSAMSSFQFQFPTPVDHGSARDQAPPSSSPVSSVDSPPPFPYFPSSFNGSSPSTAPSSPGDCAKEFSGVPQSYSYHPHHASGWYSTPHHASPAPGGPSANALGKRRAVAGDENATPSINGQIFYPSHGAIELQGHSDTSVGKRKIAENENTEPAPSTKKARKSRKNPKISTKESCPDCGVPVQACALYRHQIHTCIRRAVFLSFRCHLCNASSFCRRDALKRHLRIVHKRVSARKAHTSRPLVRRSQKVTHPEITPQESTPPVVQQPVSLPSTPPRARVAFGPPVLPLEVALSELHPNQIPLVRPGSHAVVQLVFGRKLEAILKSTKKWDLPGMLLKDSRNCLYLATIDESIPQGVLHPEHNEALFTPYVQASQAQGQQFFQQTIVPSDEAQVYNLSHPIQQSIVPNYGPTACQLADDMPSISRQTYGVEPDATLNYFDYDLYASDDEVVAEYPQHANDASPTSNRANEVQFQDTSLNYSDYDLTTLISTVAETHSQHDLDNLESCLSWLKELIKMAEAIQDTAPASVVAEPGLFPASCNPSSIDPRFLSINGAPL